MHPEMITRQKAGFLIKEALLGAQLVEVCARSMVVTLLFETSNIVSDWTVGVKLSILTSANFLSPVRNRYDNKCEFQEERALFVSAAYRKIGELIKSIDLNDYGELEIGFGASVAVLFLDEQDRESDDSVWVIEIESTPERQLAPFKHIACMVEGDTVNYYLGIDETDLGSG